MKRAPHITRFLKTTPLLRQPFGTTLLMIIFSSLVVFGAITGCATVELGKEGREIDEKAVTTISPGSTTRSEIVQAFGEPTDSIIKAGGREELYYEQTVDEARSYLGGLIIDKKRIKEQKYTLKVIVKDNVVESYRYELREEK
jgi:outer membrane protein assembly factor BamE (lipoprotein component of BamABCDE complex)